MNEDFRQFPIPVTQALAVPRDYMGLDTETDAMSEVDPVPPLVCMATSVQGFKQLWNNYQAVAVFREMARRAKETNTPIVAHFLRFDLTVLIREDPSLLEVIFDLLELGLLECTFNNEKLDCFARNQWSNETKGRMIFRNGEHKRFGIGLDGALSYRRGLVVEKDKEIRTTFGPLRGLDVSQYPKRHYDYAIDDGEYVRTLRIAQDEDDILDPPAPGLYTYADAPAQARADFCLQIMRWVGVRTDRARTNEIRDRLAARKLQYIGDLIRWGFYRPARVRPVAKDIVPPSKDTKVVDDYIRAMTQARGIHAITTAETSKGKKKQQAEDKPARLATSKDVIAGYNDPKLDALKAYESIGKTMSYVEVLSNGHDRPIYSEPNNLVSNGRTSWGSDNEESQTSEKTMNLQQLPGEPGIRECYIPPPGYCIWTVDYSMLELCTVAQACLWLLGESRLAELINQGEDLHSLLACMFLAEVGVHMTVDEFKWILKNDPKRDIYAGLTAKDLRNAAKRANFGFWGGMGVDRFLETNYKLGLTRELVTILKRALMRMLPEMRPYFNYITKIVDKGGGQIVQLTSGRIRTEMGLVKAASSPFCELANGIFSGLAADGAKHAMYLLTKEMLTDTTSPLYGSRMFAFVHDEFQGWSHRSVVSQAVQRVAHVAKGAMQDRVPDVKINVSFDVSYRLRKDAQEQRNKDGEVIPWEESDLFHQMVLKGEIKP